MQAVNNIHWIYSECVDSEPVDSEAADSNTDSGPHSGPLSTERRSLGR